MNNSNHPIWEEIQARKQGHYVPVPVEPEPGTTSPNISNWFREKIREQIFKSKTSQLVSIVPQPQWREAIRDRSPKRLELIWLREQQQQCTEVTIEAQNNAREWTMRCHAWPHEWQPMFLFVGQFRFVEFAECTAEVSLTDNAMPIEIGFRRKSTPNSKDQEEHETANDESTQADAYVVRLSETGSRNSDLDSTSNSIVRARAAAAHPLGVVEDAKWQADGKLNFAVECHADVVSGFAIAELFSLETGNSRQLLERIVLPLQAEEDSQRWTGETVLTRPDEDKVELIVRPLGPDDLWLLSRRSPNGQTQVSQFLAQQFYTPVPLEAAEEGYRFQLADDASLPDVDPIWCMQVSPRESTVAR